MAASLDRRVRALEDASGEGGCPRCGGLLVVLVGREFSSASKHGKKLTEQEYREFEAEEDQGRCPVCGAKATEITLRWPEDVP